MTLYENMIQYKDKLDNLEFDEDGCVIGQEELDALEGAFDEKAEQVGIYIKNLGATEDAVAAEIKNLQARKKSLENKQEWLKDYLGSMLTAVGKKDFETGKVKLSFRKSVSVEVDESAQLDEKYLTIKTTTAPNKTAIKDALKNGEEIEGCQLVEKQNIQVK